MAQNDSKTSIEEARHDGGRQNSLVTIFVIWNTIMGTSLLTMPWAMEKAGLLIGPFLVFLMGALCLYTAYCNLRVHQQFGSISADISELAKTLLGTAAEYIAKIFSIIVLLGATIVYWILMSNFLYHSVTFVHDKVEGKATYNESLPPVLCSPFQTDDVKDDQSTFSAIWNLEYTVPLFLILIIGPLMNFKSPTFFTKFNSLGTVSVFYIIIFVIIKATNGFRVDISRPNSSAYTPLANSSFPATSGVLGLSFFIHNIITAIMRNNSNQKNNGRDLSIAFSLVTCTYLFIGLVSYCSFPLVKSCIADNILNNYTEGDLLTVIARIFLFFQLSTVFPLVAYMLRVQILLAITGRAFPGWLPVALLNAIVIAICVLFAIFLPRIGTILRYTGAISAFVHTFTLPCALRLAAQRKNGHIPPLSWVIHISIPIFGAANLIGQFFVNV